MNQEKILSRKTANIGILTVVTEEQQAVLSSFNIGVKDYTLLDNRFFYEKDVAFNQELTKRIVVLQSTDQGNLSIINAYYAILKNYELDYLFLVGIAGSIQEKIRLCDVIIGTSVIYYEKKKDGITIQFNF